MKDLLRVFGGTIIKGALLGAILGYMLSYILLPLLVETPIRWWRCLQ